MYLTQPQGTAQTVLQYPNTGEPDNLRTTVLHAPSLGTTWRLFTSFSSLQQLCRLYGPNLLGLHAVDCSTHRTNYLGVTIEPLFDVGEAVGDPLQIIGQNSSDIFFCHFSYAFSLLKHTLICAGDLPHHPLSCFQFPNHLQKASSLHLKRAWGELYQGKNDSWRPERMNTLQVTVRSLYAKIVDTSAFWTFLSTVEKLPVWSKVPHVVIIMMTSLTKNYRIISSIIMIGWIKFQWIVQVRSTTNEKASQSEENLTAYRLRLLFHETHCYYYGRSSTIFCRIVA